MRRISVVGNSGSGKTTLGRALAARLGVPFVELDAINHQPGWRPIDRGEFRDRVAAITAQDGWVIDGNYSAVRDLIWARADTVVWFDLPRHTVLRQVLFRTVRRGVTRVELWNGNRERLSSLLRVTPSESVVLWSLTQHSKYRRRYRTAATDPALTHLTFVRIASRRDAHRLLNQLGPAQPTTSRGC